MIVVNAQCPVKAMNPVHGVNNGPLHNDMVDLSPAYKQAGFPVARLHDVMFPYAVDIARIFPDMSADESDPASYRFTNTDHYLTAIKNCGMETIYRLGPSIEHSPEKRFIGKPTDYLKWARVCVNIIRHYNEGWADGFHYDIKYWEIWNEPNLPDGHNWTGTLEEYCDMYVAAATYIKQQCPSIKIGGPTVSSIMAVDFIHMFLTRVKEADAPLDFFSWHKYDQDPEIYRRWVRDSKRYLKEHGFNDTIVICDEWNWHDNIHSQGEYIAAPDPKVRETYYEKMRSIFGASFVASTLMVFQQEGLDIGAYYDSQSTGYWGGVFNFFGVPQKTFYTFEAFDKLYRLGTEVETICPKYDGSPYTYALAAAKDDKVNILISRFDGQEEYVDVRINGLVDGKKKADIYALTEDKDLVKIRTEYYNGNNVIETVKLEKYAVVLVKIENA